MESKELKIAQNYIESLIINEINDPATNYSRVKFLLKEAKLVDTLRRQAWHEEKFGAYDRAADEVIEMFSSNEFTSDDVPF